MMKNKVMSQTILRWTPRMYFKSIFQKLFTLLLIPCIMFMFAEHLEAKDPEKGSVEKTAGHSNAEGKLHPVGLQLGWLHQFQFAGYYAAIEKGFYRDAGFKVTITEGRPGIRPVEEVVSGRANYAVGRASVLLHRLHGKPVVVLASIFQHSASIFLAKRESGIQTPQDMIGRRVMLLKGDDAAEYMAMFRKEGISLEQIRIIPSSFDVDDLVKGKTDVFNAYSTNEPYYLETQKIPMSIIDPKTYGIDFYGDCLFTSEQELKERPDQVKAFREASLRGWQYAMDHPEEIIDLILTTYGAKKTREHLIFEARAIRKLMLPDLIQIGHMNPGRWHHIADIYVDLGMADSGYSLKGFIYDPNPKPDYTWIRWAFGVAVFLCLLIGLSSIVLFLFNRRLQVEVRQRKQVEKALRESEKTFRELIEHLPVAIAILDKNENTEYANRKYMEKIGYSEVNKNIEEWYSLAYPDEEYRKLVIKQWNAKVEKAVREGKEIEPSEYKVTCKDGKVRVMEISGTFIADKMLAVFNDITERKLVEKKIARFGRIFEDSLNEIYLFDVDTLKFTQVNSAAQHNLGYTMEELQKMTPVDLKPEVTTELFAKLLSPLRKGEKEKIVFETVHKRKDQSLYDVEVHVQLLGYEHKALFAAIILDITERKRAEEEHKKLQEQLLQSRKIEAIGSLVGGIAHEFNNILTTIIGNTQLAIDDTPERNPTRECLEEIQSASSRAKDVVRQLLGFAQKSVFQLQPVHLSPVIKDTMILIRASVPAAIEICQNLSCEPDMVMADSSQVNLMLINLCTNARNAMQEEGGVLDVKLENTTLDDKSAARYEGLGLGNYVKMTVRDTGHGIDPKIIDRIFEPYFTTRSLAEATGMGLAVVHGIVKRHNGAIIVDSEPGKGTVFEVLFPLTKAEKEQKSENPEVLPAGAERILFVDDEKTLVEIAKRSLEMQGYQVEAKSDPVEALDLFRSKPDRFDLIITDMSMPKMTGDKLAKEILSIRPGMPIILCSGFSEKIDAEKARALGIRKYIEKPLYMSDFAVTVRKVLNQGN